MRFISPLTLLLLRLIFLVSVPIARVGIRERFAANRSVSASIRSISIMSRSGSTAGANLRPASGTVATTITIDNGSTSSSSSSAPEVLVLRLKRKEKKVSWKEGTVDNEFMNKKSSKKCCIFHKEKPFDEDESSDEDECHESSGEAHGGGGCCLKS